MSESIHVAVCPSATKKNGNKYKNNSKKLKGEVGMAVPKSTQTRVVVIITYIHGTSLRLLFNKCFDEPNVGQSSLPHSLPNKAQRCAH